MAHFIDRRLNPKDRSLGNRRRFIKRIRDGVRKAVEDSVRQRGIADIDRDDEVKIPANDIREPGFRHAREGGHREHVLPGNKTYRAGDRIDKPAGGSGSGREGAPDGDAEDSFRFVLSREEFLEIFFENLKLPDLVKRQLKNMEARKPQRAGRSVTGSPANLNVRRSMSNALGRRLALHRPRDWEIDALKRRISELETQRSENGETGAELASLYAELEQLLGRQKRVLFLDPLDVRYNYYEMQPEPVAKAVMFCLMDVSASMGEREKDLAKRFFVLLHLFLKHRYDKVDLVFIRHTHEAAEVDEETFFFSRQSGGTMVSTALNEMKRIIDARYPPADWNIYAAQASDGENYSGDSALCADILTNGLMRVVQYFAYVEIIDEEETRFLTDDKNGTELWRAYVGIARNWPNFALKRIAGPADIYPVFRELFAETAEAENA